MREIDVPWVNKLQNWGAMRTSDGSPITEEMVNSLLSAKTAEEAKRYYWKLDGTVCSNGIVFESAFAVVQVLLAGLPNCGDSARLYSLELLGQIVVGESDQLAPDVVERCVAEIMRASWYFLYCLQYDNVERMWLYVDLLGVLAESFAEFRPIVKLYLESALNSRDVPEKDVALIMNTLAEIAR